MKPKLLSLTMLLVGTIAHTGATPRQASGTTFDVSSWLNATADAIEGWKNEGGWFLNTGAGGSHYNGNAYTVAPFVENWHDVAYGPLDDCTLSQTLKNIPAGSYTLQADMIAVWQGNSWGGMPEAPATGVELYANDHATAVGTNNNAPERMSVDFTLAADGTVNLGVRATSTNANWIAIDNIYLLYKGSEQQVIDGEKRKVRTELQDCYTPEEADELISQAGDDFAALEELRKSVATLPKGGPLNRYVGQITIDGHAITYVESLDLYLCSIPTDHFGSDYAATISFSPGDASSRLLIEQHPIDNDSTLVFTMIECSKNYELTAQLADGSSVSKSLTFTSLPVVSLYGSFNNSYSEGYIAVNEPDKRAAELLCMKAKWRGGISNSPGKHKRNYHVKLLDATGQKLEKKFFGLRNDNSWILEACQIDMSRVRNRVLTDLWNDFAKPPYYIAQEPKALTGTRGHFVELVLNGEYRGIYCMTENMDRKQMKLRKYDEDTQTMHGQLWKSKEWSYAVFMGHDRDNNYYPGTSPVNFNNFSESWDQYYVKYPSIEDVSPTDWQYLYDAVDLVCTSSDNYFIHYAPEYFDMPVIIDYYILMETIMSSDNHGKNMFFGIYDKRQSRKITIGVWDMDAACGQRWSDDYWHSPLMRPDQDYEQFITNHEHGDYNLFRRLRNTNADDFNNRVRLRYRDLRSTYLDTEQILNRFRSYLGEFKKCGADQREYSRWNGDTDIARRNLDFDNEMDYLADWFTRRMEYLDTKRFDIASLPPSGIELVSHPVAAHGDVYDLSGKKVTTADNARALKPGVYIIKGKKVIVK